MPQEYHPTEDTLLTLSEEPITTYTASAYILPTTPKLEDAFRESDTGKAIGRTDWGMQLNIRTLKPSEFLLSLSPEERRGLPSGYQSPEDAILPSMGKIGAAYPIYIESEPMLDYLILCVSITIGGGRKSTHGIRSDPERVIAATRNALTVASDPLYEIHSVIFPYLAPGAINLEFEQGVHPMLREFVDFLREPPIETGITKIGLSLPDPEQYAQAQRMLERILSGEEDREAAAAKVEEEKNEFGAGLV